MTTPNEPIPLERRRAPPSKYLAGLECREPAQVQAARHIVSVLLGGEAVAADVVLLTSELVSNAVLHAGGGRVVFGRRANGRQVVVRMYDNSRQHLPDNLAPNGEHGRGGELLRRIAIRAGYNELVGGRKCTWAVVSLEDPPSRPEPEAEYELLGEDVVLEAYTEDAA